MLPYFRLTFFLSVFLFSIQASPVFSQNPSSMRGSLQSPLLPRADIKLSVPVEGIVGKYLVEEGEMVAEGQALFQLQSTSERLRVEQAEGTLISVRAEVEKTEKALSRILELSEISSDKDVELAKFDAANAQGRLKNAEAALALAQSELEKKTVRSPITGLFLKKYKMPGEAVNKLELIARILDITKVEMVVFADALLWGKFKEGDVVPAELTSGPDKGMKFEGKVSFVDRVIDPAAGTFRVKILIEPSEEIVVGLSSRILIE